MSPAVAMLACAVALLAIAPTAQASKGVVSFFGSQAGTGTTGGLFNNPRGVAINQTTGDIYVVDGSSNRIQRFSSSGAFISAWGRDVVTGGATTAETCTVAADCKAGSTGFLPGEFNGPQGIAIDQSTGDVYVTEQTNLRVQKFSSTGVFQRMWGRDVLNPAAGTTHEICTAVDAGGVGCKIGTTGATGGAFASLTGYVAVVPTGAPNAGNVIVADSGNRRVQEFTAAGDFVRTFGFDVTSATGGADNTGTGFEICTAAVAGAANCKASVAGNAAGQFGASSPTRVAADSTGAIYTVESGANFRVQKFTPQVGPPTLAPSIFVGAPLSGDASTNTPTDVAIGSGNDVFVTRAYPAAGFTPPERRVLQYNAAGTVLQDTHMAGGVINGVNGLAVNVSNGRLAVSSTQYSASPTITAHRVYILDNVVAPTVTIAPVSGVTARGATFNGQINPNGAPAGYHFEYSKDNVNWTAFPPSDADAGSGSGNVPATQAITGVLEPNTLYTVRLVGKLTWGNESATSSTTTFMTGSAAPTVGPVTNADADDTSATLTGSINPNSQATTYRFEYGTTIAYGANAPVPDGSAGDEDETVPVSEEISGLDPATTYHYRLVATNASGTTEGDDHTFTTSGTAPTSCSNADFRKGYGEQLPDCRAYEQVSPADKSGFDVGNIPDANVDAGGPATVDGNAVAFHSFGAFAGTPWGGVGTLLYLSRRDTSGWDTTWLVPRPLDARGVIATGVSAFSPDMSESVVFSGAPLTTDIGGSSNNYYLQDHGTRALDRLASFGLIGSGVQGEGSSRDLSHFAVDTPAPAADIPGQPDPTVRKVYEVVGGETRLVSRQPGDNQPFQTTAALGGGFGTLSTQGAVSEDGEHLYFTAPQTGPLRVVYRRDGGTTTIVASPSKRTTIDPAAPKAKEFQVATPDGNRVFFKSVERLTNDANSPINPDSFQGDLYRYDVEADELVDLSAGTQGLTKADVLGVLGISDDGDRAYFAATGQVVPGEGAPDDGRPNLYYWEDDGTPQGSVRYIGTLAPSLGPNNPRDEMTWSWGSDRTAQVTPDGSRLVFQSYSDELGYDPAGTSQVYMYDATANDGAGDLACLSCDPDDAPMGPVEVPAKSNTGGQLGDFPRFVSTNGHRVIFSTPNPLLDRDTNGKYDAYMWEDGELFLLSTGKSGHDSYAFAASANGDDVFFRTREPLVPSDGDTLIDLYTAHVGGGFASQQNEPKPDCVGDVCKGQPSTPPAARTPSSSDNHGLGNVKELPDCSRYSKKAKKLTAQSKRLRRKAANASGHRTATRLRKQAKRLSKQSKAQRAKAKRCTRSNQEATK